MKTFAYTTRYKTLPGDLHTPVSTYLKVRDLFRKVFCWKVPITTEWKTTALLSD